MESRLAINYSQGAYHVHQQRINGLGVANEGLIKAFCQYSQFSEIFACTEAEADFEAFFVQSQPWLPANKKALWLDSSRPGGIHDPFVIFRGDPRLGKLAWQRRYGDETAYSLCGVTHTICSRAVMSSIGDLLIAPVRSWDAVVCTSTAVKTVYRRTLENWGQYLAEKLQADPKYDFQLPVIPLGVAWDSFPQGVERAETRAAMRQKFGITDDEVVVLYVGRLDPMEKIHPVPMYMALEQAAQATHSRVHFIQMGWFTNDETEKRYLEAAATFSPSVKAHLVDGRKLYNRLNIWSMADIFLSLTDNIQETFGLTPIEAMANSLPVIVSDWNGYQDTVRHGVDGLRVHTFMPPPESGINLAFDSLSDDNPYAWYVGSVAMSSGVDIQAASQALITLINDSDLRAKMGESACIRARDTYDWPVIVSAYEDLWASQEEIRFAHQKSLQSSRKSPAYPLAEDPFQVFQHYASETLGEETVLMRNTQMQPTVIAAIQSDPLSNPTWLKLVSDQTASLIVTTLTQKGPMSIGALLQSMNLADTAEIPLIYRTIGYFLKFDILRILPP